MKKFAIIFLIFTMMGIGVIPKYVSAESTVVEEWKFEGTITPKYDFMVDDVINSDDFNISGTLINESKKISLEEVNIIGVEYIKLNVPEKDKEVKVYLSDKDNSVNPFIAKAKIIVNEYNPSIKHPLDGQLIKTDKQHWKSEDGFDTIMYYDGLDNFVINSYKRPVNGELKYSGNYYAPKLGYNTVTYRFTPEDKEMDVLYGSFIVLYKAKPYMVIGKNTININVKTTTYNILLNGKKQSDHFIDNLKPNTKYKITIQQKTTPKGKNLTVWSGTVTTKK